MTLLAYASYYLGIFLLGCLHTLEPGHGKSLVALFLLGRQATWLEALSLGLTITVLHAASALLLAFVGFRLLAQWQNGVAWIGQLGLWFHLALGFVVIGLGLWQWLQSKPKASHERSFSRHRQSMASLAPAEGPCCPPGVLLWQHRHAGQAIPLNQARYSASANAIKEAPVPLGKGQVILLAVITGLLPCSMSVVALLAALHLGQVGSFAMVALALLCFSLGMGTVITLVALLISWGQNRLLQSKPGWLQKLEASSFSLRRLGALIIAGLGFYIVMSASAALFNGQTTDTVDSKASTELDAWLKPL